MPATIGKVSVGYVNNGGVPQTFDLPLPLYGYRSMIKLPYDIQRLDSPEWARYDHGDGTDDRDERTCQCEFILTPSEAATLFAAVGDDAKARARTITIEMGAGSGFCPFAPDKGPTGPFTVDAVFTTKGIGRSPYKMFRTSASFTAIGNWPAYTLPTEVAQGSLTIGTVSGLRFPPSWFEPATALEVSSTITGGSGVAYVNRGMGADSYETLFQMRCNQSKAAALLAYLTGMARVSDFGMTTGTGSYPFGILKPSSGSYTVCNISDTIEILNPRYNEFLFNLNFGLVL